MQLKCSSTLMLIDQYCIISIVFTNLTSMMVCTVPIKNVVWLDPSHYLAQQDKHNKQVSHSLAIVSSTAAEC